MTAKPVHKPDQEAARLAFLARWRASYEGVAKAYLPDTMPALEAHKPQLLKATKAAQAAMDAAYVAGDFTTADLQRLLWVRCWDMARSCAEGRHAKHAA